MKRRMIVLLVTGVIAALAIVAFAGYFTSDGWVFPTSGPAKMQLFHYEVHYNLDESQPTPDALIWIWDGEDLIHYDTMKVQTLDGIAYYTYDTSLDEVGDDYSFQFTTIDDRTNVSFGPDVY